MSTGIEELIRTYIPLGGVSRTGFAQTSCRICNDYRVRAGFKFCADQIGYNCFNCGASAKYTIGNTRISSNFREVLNAFGIDNQDIDHALTELYLSQGGHINKQKEHKSSAFTVHKTIKFPPDTFRVADLPREDDWRLVVEDYLSTRNVKLSECDFHISLTEKWLGYLLMPVYQNKRLIFFQGRYMDECSNATKYQSAGAEKTSILFNQDELFRFTDEPLFVGEGAFDALPFNGVATYGAKVSLDQIELLSKTRRDIIFLPQLDSSSLKFAQTAIENGWKISHIDGDGGMTDVGQMVANRGKLLTAFEIRKNIKSGLAAKAWVQVMTAKYNKG